MEAWAREEDDLRCEGAAEMRPGVSMMVRLGQYLYSILTTISLAQNWLFSASSLRFSASMYSWSSSSVTSTSPWSSVTIEHLGSTQAEL